MKHTYVKIFGGHYKDKCVEYWYTGWINLKIGYYKFRLQRRLDLTILSVEIFFLKSAETLRNKLNKYLNN